MNESTPIAIVTGGNSGIGKAVSLALASSGMSVVIAGRRQSENQRVAAEISDRFGVSATPIETDVSKEEDCLRLVRESAEMPGTLRLLVNNAGVGGFGKISETDSETFDMVMRTNLYSAYWCSREAYRIFEINEPDPKTGLRGTIVNISSVCGVDAWAETGIYGASKHGMTGLTRAMAEEGSQDGIRVSAICPAMVSTPMTGVSGPDYIEPEDIAKTLSYLLELSAAAWPREIVVNRRGA